MAWYLDRMKTTSGCSQTLLNGPTRLSKSRVGRRANVKCLGNSQKPAKYYTALLQSHSEPLEALVLLCWGHNPLTSWSRSCRYGSYHPIAWLSPDPEIKINIYFCSFRDRRLAVDRICMGIIHTWRSSLKGWEIQCSSDTYCTVSKRSWMREYTDKLG